MQRYANRNGHSGIVAYELGDDHIDIEFQHGPRYRYDTERPGREHVERMKALARAGRGLSTYVAQQVRERYARRLR